MIEGNLRVESYLWGGQRHLVLSGELDMATVGDFQAALEGCDRLKGLLIDTTELDFIDSIGLGALVEARNLMPRTARFDLTPGEATKKVIDITGLGELFGQPDQDRTVTSSMENIVDLQGSSLNRS